MLKRNETRWRVVSFRLFFLWLAVMSYVIVFQNFAPYLFAKTMGEDLQQQGQVQSRLWEPERHACRGQVKLMANTGQLFELCIEEKGELPGLVTSARVEMTVRQSYAGFYISDMAVLGGS